MLRTLLFALALAPTLACSPLVCTPRDWDESYDMDNASLSTMLAEGETDLATITCETACEAIIAHDGWGTIEALDSCEIAWIDGAGDAPADIAATVTCVGSVQSLCY